jgi:hypothetical protein
MDNPDILHLASNIKTVADSDVDALDQRRRQRMMELSVEGWKPSSGWACGEPERASDESQLAVCAIPFGGVPTYYFLGTRRSNYLTLTDAEVTTNG